MHLGKCSIAAHKSISFSLIVSGFFFYLYNLFSHCYIDRCLFLDFYCYKLFKVSILWLWALWSVYVGIDSEGKLLSPRIVCMLLFSHPVMSNFVTPWTVAYQASLSFTISQSLPKSISLHWWCHPAISSSELSFASTLNRSQHQRLLRWVICSHKMTKILELHLQHQSSQWIFSVDLP